MCLLDLKFSPNLCIYNKIELCLRVSMLHPSPALPVHPLTRSTKDSSREKKKTQHQKTKDLALDKDLAVDKEVDVDVDVVKDLALDQDLGTALLLPLTHALPNPLLLHPWPWPWTRTWLWTRTWTWTWTRTRTWPWTKTWGQPFSSS